MKCIECESEEIEIVEEDGREKYICENDHKNTRTIKNKGLVHREEDGEIIHESVGAVIKSEEDYLLLKRRKYPYKHSIPAGHLEEGEDPDKAATREVWEETGLKIDKEDLELIFEGEIDDRCRRGADIHGWHLYFVEIEDQDIGLESNDEAEYLEWLSYSEIKEKEVTDPVKEFLIKRGIVEE